MSAWDQFTSLYRKPESGMIAGVCAGLAEHYGWRRRVVRVIAFLLLLIAFWPVLLCYLLAAFILPTDEERGRSQAAGTSPPSAPPPRPEYHGSLRKRFERIEARTRRVEAYLHGNEYRLRSAFRDLEAGG